MRIFVLLFLLCSSLITSAAHAKIETLQTIQQTGYCQSLQEINRYFAAVKQRERTPLSHLSIRLIKGVLNPHDKRLAEELSDGTLFLQVAVWSNLLEYYKYFTHIDFLWKTVQAEDMAAAWNIIRGPCQEI